MRDIPNTTGSYNFCCRRVNAGYYNTTGDDNVNIGYQAGYNNVDDDNVFVGKNAGYAFNDGTENTMIGATAGVSFLRDRKYEDTFIGSTFRWFC